MINQTTREHTMRVVFCIKTHNFVLKELKKLSIVAISSYLQTKSSFNNFIKPCSKNYVTSNALLELGNWCGDIWLFQCRNITEYKIIFSC